MASMLLTVYNGFNLPFVWGSLKPALHIMIISATPGQQRSERQYEGHWVDTALRGVCNEQCVVCSLLLGIYY